MDVLPLEREPLFDGGDLLGLICPELGVVELGVVDPGTDVEDERRTPVGSPSPVVDGTVPLPAPSGIDMELAHVFLEVGVLPAMVTPVVEPEGESAMTPARYPVPPIPELSVMVPAVGSPARDEYLLAQISPSGSVVQAVSSPKLPVLRSTPDDSRPSGSAAMDQYLPWSASPPVGESQDSPLLPAPQPLRRMTAGQLASESGVSLPTGVAGGHSRMPDLSREGSFDVLQDKPDSGASPLVFDGVRGCQYRMTSYDEESGGPDFTPVYGVQLHDPRLLEYVGAPESARLLSRSPEYWLHHLGHEKTLAAVLQLQHDAGLILSNVQVLQQLVTDSIERRRRSCGSRLVAGRFRRMLCNMWCRRTGFVGQHIIWWLWACGGHLLLRTFGDPCRRRHAMLACRAMTVSRICHSDIRW